MLADMPTVLVVEDDHALRDVLARALREEGFGVRTAVDGTSALASADPAPDVLVLDIGLPDADGRDVLTALRSRGVTAPALFLTARDGVQDRLAGFAVGADDYVTKPFAVAELVARVRVLVRRTVPPTAGPGLVIDAGSHAVVGSLGSAVLSPTEMQLIAALLANPGEVVRRRTLVAAAWPGGRVSDNTIDQHVARLRRKLAEVSPESRLETRRGIGYQLTSA